jgi:pimeloyl-ACP methyl ester carboxylesterase
MGLIVPKFKAPEDLPPPTTEDFRKAGTKCVKTAEGRCIEYSVWGSVDPDAKIVINGNFAYGQAPPFQKALQDMKIRYIDITLPGLGLSQINPGLRHYLWPKTDVEPVLAAEGISDSTKLYILGQSAGTQYAMAMAQHFGPERVIKLGLRAPYVPKHVSEQEKMKDGQPTFWSLKDLEPPGACFPRCFACNTRLVYRPCLLRTCWSCCGPGKDTWTKLGATHMTREQKLFMTNEKFKQMLAPHDYQGLMHFMAKEVALDEDKGLDVYKLKEDGFKGPAKVLVWWAEDDEDTGPEHGKWVADFFESEQRVMKKPTGHTGATDWYHVEYLQALVGPTVLKDNLA